MEILIYGHDGIMWSITPPTNFIQNKPHEYQKVNYTHTLLSPQRKLPWEKGWAKSRCLFPCSRLHQQAYCYITSIRNKDFCCGIEYCLQSWTSGCTVCQISQVPYIAIHSKSGEWTFRCLLNPWLLVINLLTRHQHVWNTSTWLENKIVSIHQIELIRKGILLHWEAMSIHFSKFIQQPHPYPDKKRKASTHSQY